MATEVLSGSESQIPVKIGLRAQGRSLFLAVALCGLVSPAHAYIDGAPTLGRILNESPNVIVLQVEKVSAEKRVIIYKKVADLKGTSAADPIKHHIGEGSHPREPQLILDWAQEAQESGRLAVFYHNGKASRICLGTYWYECIAAEAPWWHMTRGAPELSLAYCGSATRLRDHVAAMLAGKEVVIPVVKHQLHNGAGFLPILFKNVPRGKGCPVWRIKASLRMPGLTHEAAHGAVGDGAAGPEHVPALLEALKQQQSRKQAADDLGAIGPPANAAAPALRTALKDPDLLIRVSAAEALARIDPADPAPVPALVELLKDKTVKVRKSAAHALGNLGPDAKAAVPGLVQALKDADQAVRWTAAESLGQVGTNAGAAVPALVELLRDPQSRSAAADALGQIGAGAKAAIPPIQELLKDADRGTRWTAALALLRIDPSAAKPALPMFVEGLKSGNEKVYWDARWYITMMGPAAKDAAPAVTERLRGGDSWCAYALVAIAGPEATAAIPTLAQAIKSSFGGEGDWAADNLARIGPAAIPALMELLKDNNAPTRARAVRALAAIGPKSKDVVPAILGALKDVDPTVRVKAAETLGALDPKAKEPVPALTQALKDENVWVRLTASWSLIALSRAEAKVTVPVLIAALGEADFWARRSAAQALTELGPAAKEAAPTLQARLQDSDAGARVAAAGALLKLEMFQAKDALPVLLPALMDKAPWTRRHAAIYLGRLGPAAKEAIPALTQALKDDAEDVRQAASEALKLIQGK